MGLKQIRHRCRAVFPLAPEYENRTRLCAEIGDQAERKKVQAQRSDETIVRPMRFLSFRTEHEGGNCQLHVVRSPELQESHRSPLFTKGHNF